MWGLAAQTYGLRRSGDGGIGDAEAVAGLAESAARHGADALAFRAAMPGGGRVGYTDTTGVLPGYSELIELGGAFEEVFGRFYRASIAWDGNDSIRSFI